MRRPHPAHWLEWRRPPPPRPAFAQVFLSYRVFSDSKLVGLVYEELVKRSVARPGGGKMRVYLDRVCIKPGMPWRDQFIEGLTHSLLFVPFVSRRSLLSKPRARCQPSPPRQPWAVLMPPQQPRRVPRRK